MLSMWEIRYPDVTLEGYRATEMQQKKNDEFCILKKKFLDFPHGGRGTGNSDQIRNDK